MSQPPLLTITARVIAIGELPSSNGECAIEVEYEDPYVDPETEENEVELLCATLPCSEAQAHAVKPYLFKEVTLTLTPLEHPRG